MFSGDAEIGLDEPLGRDPSEADDDVGADDAYLRAQMLDAGVSLLGQRITVARRTAFENIGNINVVTRNADRKQLAVKQLSRGTDKRDSRRILSFPGRLSDEHQTGIGRSRAEHQIGSGRAKRTSLTGLTCGADTG